MINAQNISRKRAVAAQPSANLEKLLEIVNAVPLDVAVNVIPNKTALEIVLKNAPEVFRNHVAPHEIKSEIDFHEAIMRFKDAVMWRNILFSFQYPLEPETKLIYDFDKPLSFVIQRDENGIVHLRENLLLEVLKEGVDAASVRSCANRSTCQRLFFKKRKDQVCCSVTCSKQLQTRKWRLKLSEEQKEEQKQRYKTNRIKKEQK